MPSVEVDVDVLVALLVKGALAAIGASAIDVIVAAPVIEVDEELLVAIADMP